MLLEVKIQNLSFKFKEDFQEFKEKTFESKMFGFFLRTNKTFRLPTTNSQPLKSFPTLCSSGSNIYPHIISQISQVIPQIISPSNNLTNIPLFIACQINSDKTLSMLDLETNKTTPFYLLFFPDPQQPPLKGVDSQIEPIVKEYWKSIQPMLICRDMSGFYLGSANDSNIMLFEQCNIDQAECSIYKVISGYNEFTMQSEENIIFNNTPVSLRKISKYPCI